MPPPPPPSPPPPPLLLGVVLVPHADRAMSPLIPAMGSSLLVQLMYVSAFERLLLGAIYTHNWCGVKLARILKPAPSHQTRRRCGLAVQRCSHSDGEGCGDRESLMAAIVASVVSA